MTRAHRRTATPRRTRQVLRVPSTPCEYSIVPTVSTPSTPCEYSECDTAAHAAGVSCASVLGAHTNALCLRYSVALAHEWLRFGGFGPAMSTHVLTIGECDADFESSSHAAAHTNGAGPPLPLLAPDEAAAQTGLPPCGCCGRRCNRGGTSGGP